MSGRLAVPLVVLALLICGCWGGPAPGESTGEIADRIEGLEKDSRSRDDRLRAVESQLNAVKADKYELEQLLKETKQLVKALEDTGQLPTEKPFAFEVTRVDFGFLTCAIDTDGKKGDDAIAAYVSLYDQFDSSLKVAGSFRFELFDLARSKDHVIQSWSFEPEAAARHWQRFPACYQLRLPFGGRVRQEKVVLKVTFRRVGKKELTATREVTVERP